MYYLYDLNYLFNQLVESHKKSTLLHFSRVYMEYAKK